MARELTGAKKIIIADRAEALSYYSPISFLREISTDIHQEFYGSGLASNFGAGTHEELVPMQGGVQGQWLLQLLPWDTEFFGVTTFRLFTGLFPAAASVVQLAAAAHYLREQLAKRGSFYAFSIVPAEDIRLIQALTGGGWHLVETRVTFYRPVNEPLLLPPSSTRYALPDEALHIGQISAAARNEFDRFHADPWFGDKADALLTRYAEAAVEGSYASAVLVPNEPGVPVDSFLAVSDEMPGSANAGNGYSRVLLTAVGAANRGWHVRLVAEAVRRAAQLNLAYVVMTTQATNRAVFRTCEKLGFRFGSTTHVFACHNR
jgi:dTDP-4-amino-4,6-dideoxy-D-galactose acyltransferase